MIDNSFTGCSISGPPLVTQGGRSSFLILFHPGTSVDALDAVANGLMPSTKSDVQAAIQSGVAGVERPTCNPLKFEWNYRSATSDVDFERLRASLPSLPGATRLQPG